MNFTRSKTVLLKGKYYVDININEMLQYSMASEIVNFTPHIMEREERKKWMLLRGNVFMEDEDFTGSLNL